MLELHCPSAIAAGRDAGKLGWQLARCQPGWQLACVIPACVRLDGRPSGPDGRASVRTQLHRHARPNVFSKRLVSLDMKLTLVEVVALESWRNHD